MIMIITTFYFNQCSLFIISVDDYLAKTDKSKAFHSLVKHLEDAAVPPAHATLTVYDGNATFHSMTVR